ncbi:MAG: peptidylprolyl isomerase [Saprospiraceae bacterium]|nr:peptidylprolyl isomerase [Saprospiraceae bacterium]
MALIGKIRKHSWLLIVLIGGALAGFVIMDMTSNRLTGGGQIPSLVEVDGEKVNWVEFQNAERILYTGSTTDVFSRRNYLYNYFVDRALVDHEAEENGLAVPREELMDLQFGNNLSPLIQQRFANPNTGMVDRTQLNAIKQNIDQGQMTPQLREYWAHQEQEIITERLTAKLTNLVSKGLYTPTWLVESTNADQSVRTDFLYVQVPYEEVPENDIKVTDADLNSYLSAHQGEYTNPEEVRIIHYVSYDVIPTRKDTSDLHKQIDELITEFKMTQNDTQFVENNYGSMDPGYVKKEQVSPIVADSVFELPIGTVIGPYIEDNAYKAVKIRDRMMVPDSVHARHILRRAQTMEQYQAAQKTADSLITLLKAGESFDSLAANYTQDPSGSLNGGDLGNVGLGTFVKEFNDLVFFNAELNQPYTVITNFGVHVVEVLDRTYETKEEGAQLAYLNLPIVPSETTQDSLYDKVLEFVGEHRDLKDLESAVASMPGKSVQISTPFKQNDFTISALGSGQTSREIIRWAYEPSSEIGNVSPEVYIYQEPTLYYNNRYVVAGLASIDPKGPASLASVRPTIEGLVKNHKKAEILLKELQGAELQKVVQTYSVAIDTAKGVNFLTDFVAGLGEEPAVAAYARTAPLNQVSQPIEGVRGVYLIKPINRTEASPPNVATLRKSYTSQLANQAKAGVIQSLRKNADIEDHRYTFY